MAISGVQSITVLVTEITNNLSHLQSSRSDNLVQEK